MSVRFLATNLKDSFEPFFWPLACTEYEFFMLAHLISHGNDQTSWPVRSTIVTAWSFKSTVGPFQWTLHQWSWHPKKKSLSVDLCSVLYIERALTVPSLYNTLSQPSDKQQLLQVFSPDQGVSDPNSAPLLLPVPRRHDRWHCVPFGKQLQLPSTACRQRGESQPERGK